MNSYKPGNKDHLKAKMLEVLEKTLGIVTPACKEVGICRETYYKWMREDPDFKAAVESLDQVQGDFVESQLFKKIKEGSERSILFYMKYKGKKKGYSDSIDITTNGENLTNNIKVDIIRSKKDEDL